MKQTRMHKIEISSHAMERLKERVGSYGDYKSWEDMVKTARYKGRHEGEMTQSEYQYLCSHLNHHTFNNSMRIRVLDNFAYIFRGNSGHARTLVTVIKIEA